jgi:hypothetical protein
MNPSARLWVCLSTSLRTWSALIPRVAATRGTCNWAYAGLMCGSRPLALAVTASAGTADVAGASPRIGVMTPIE